MRKSILIVAMILLVLPCFAEVRVAKGSYKFIKKEEFWDDNYFIYRDNPDLNAWAIYYMMDSSGELSGVCDVLAKQFWILGASSCYNIRMIKKNNGTARVFVSYCVLFDEIFLYDKTYYDYKSAQQDFDYLCNQYYKKAYMY